MHIVSHSIASHRISESLVELLHLLVWLYYVYHLHNERISPTSSSRVYNIYTYLCHTFIFYHLYIQLVYIILCCYLLHCHWMICRLFVTIFMLIVVDYVCHVILLVFYLSYYCVDRFILFNSQCYLSYLSFVKICYIYFVIHVYFMYPLYLCWY